MVVSMSDYSSYPSASYSSEASVDDDYTTTAAEVESPGVEVETEESATPAKSSGSKRRSSSRAKSGDTSRAKMAAMREAITAYVTIADSDDATRTIMAALLGCDDDAVEIAVHAATTKVDTSMISTIADVRSSTDDLSAVVDVAAIVEDKTALRSLWSLLSSVADVPAAPTKLGVTQAAAQAVRVIRDLDDDAVDTLTQAAAALS